MERRWPFDYGNVSVVLVAALCLLMRRTVFTHRIAGPSKIRFGEVGHNPMTERQWSFEKTNTLLVDPDVFTQTYVCVVDLSDQRWRPDGI